MSERKRIGLKTVRALKPGETIWDGALAGFGARRQTGETVAYILKFRTTEGRQRWVNIGRHGALTPDQAREEAQRLLGRVAQGADPAADKQGRRSAPTVAELCDEYWTAMEKGQVMTRRGAKKKPSTMASDRGRIEGHIKPMLGALKVPTVTSQDIETFMHAVAHGATAARTRTGKKRGMRIVRGGSGTASRTVGLLGAIFSFAVRRGMRADNPVRGVQRPADAVRDRRLSDAEYGMLGAALRRAEAEGVWPPAVAATRFLALSGWRSGEVLGLRWGEISLASRSVVLADTKSGKSLRPLSRAACDVLAGIGHGADTELVFAPARGQRPMTGFAKAYWRQIAALGPVPTDITPHTLRHSFASLASDLEYSELTVAALLGHRGGGITRGYIHRADAPLLAAADAVARRTQELMGDEPARAEVIELRPAAAAA